MIAELLMIEDVINRKTYYLTFTVTLVVFLGQRIAFPSISDYFKGIVGYI